MDMERDLEAYAEQFADEDGVEREISTDVDSAESIASEDSPSDGGADSEESRGSEDEVVADVTESDSEPTAGDEVVADEPDDDNRAVS